ncbi:MAG: hypothetical protein KVP17_004169 [Porospora cf. gigantea B]|nr:MAG: hypothetical protein KVP17_004169 [Porospora cf. gigantea B]
MFNPFKRKKKKSKKSGNQTEGGPANSTQVKMATGSHWDSDSGSSFDLSDDSHEPHKSSTLQEIAKLRGEVTPKADIEKSSGLEAPDLRAKLEEAAVDADKLKAEEEAREAEKRAQLKAEHEAKETAKRTRLKAEEETREAEKRAQLKADEEAAKRSRIEHELALERQRIAVEDARLNIEHQKEAERLRKERNDHVSALRGEEQDALKAERERLDRDKALGAAELALVKQTQLEELEAELKAGRKSIEIAREKFQEEMNSIRAQWRQQCLEEDRRQSNADHLQMSLLVEEKTQALDQSERLERKVQRLEREIQDQRDEFERKMKDERIRGDEEVLRLEGALKATRMSASKELEEIRQR